MSSFKIANYCLLLLLVIPLIITSLCFIYGFLLLLLNRQEPIYKNVPLMCTPILTHRRQTHMPTLIQHTWPTVNETGFVQQRQYRHILIHAKREPVWILISFAFSPSLPSAYQYCHFFFFFAYARSPLLRRLPQSEDQTCPLA